MKQTEIYKNDTLRNFTEKKNNNKQTIKVMKPNI